MTDSSEASMIDELSELPVVSAEKINDVETAEEYSGGGVIAETLSTFH